MPDRIVHVVHPSPVLAVPKGSRVPRHLHVRTTTPARVQEVDPAEMTPAMTFSRAGTGRTTVVVGFRGRLWIPVPGPGGAEALFAALECAAAPDDGPGRRMEGLLGGTPVALSRWRTPREWGARSCRGEPRGSMAVREVLRDGTPESSAMASEFVSTRVVFSGDRAWIRLLDPMAEPPRGALPPVLEPLPGAGAHRWRTPLSSRTGSMQAGFHWMYVDERPGHEAAGSRISVAVRRGAPRSQEDQAIAMANSLPHLFRENLRSILSHRDRDARTGRLREAGYDLDGLVATLAHLEARGATGGIPLHEAHRVFVLAEGAVDALASACMRDPAADRTSFDRDEPHWWSYGVPLARAVEEWREHVLPVLRAKGLTPDLAPEDEAALVSAFAP